MKILVAYNSRTGNTRFVAEKAAQQLGADLCEVIDKKNRDGRSVYLTGSADAAREKLTEIEVSKPIEGYDLIVIGSPVWAGKITPAIRKFLVSNNFSDKKVALFVTLGKDSPEKSLGNMKAAFISNQIVGEIGFKRALNRQAETEQQIKNWCSQIQKSLSSE